MASQDRHRGPYWTLTLLGSLGLHDAIKLSCLIHIQKGNPDSRALKNTIGLRCHKKSHASFAIYTCRSKHVEKVAIFQIWRPYRNTTLPKNSFALKGFVKGGGFNKQRKVSRDYGQSLKREHCHWTLESFTYLQV